MLKQEKIDEERVKTYSDANKYILQVETNQKYGEAIDILPLMYTYVETDEDIVEDDEATEQVDDPVEDNEQFQG